MGFAVQSHRWVRPTDGITAAQALYPAASSSTVGVPSGLGLTVQNGDLTTTANGQVIDSLEIIGGRIIVQHANVTIRRCYFHSPVSGMQSSSYIVSGYTPATAGLLVDQCLIDGGNAEWGSGSNWNSPTGITGDQFTMQRCEVRGTGDVVDAFPGLGSVAKNIVLGGNVLGDGLGNWIHDLWNHQNTNHVDGLQCYSTGNNFKVIGNRIANGNTATKQANGQTSCINMGESGATSADGWTIQGNLLAGGGFPFYAVSQATNLTVTDNVFDDLTFTTDQSGTSITGNNGGVFGAYTGFTSTTWTHTTWARNTVLSSGALIPAGS